MIKPFEIGTLTNFIRSGPEEYRTLYYTFRTPVGPLRNLKEQNAQLQHTCVLYTTYVESNDIATINSIYPM